MSILLKLRTSLTISIWFFLVSYCHAQKNNQYPSWKSASCATSEMDLAYQHLQNYRVIEVDLKDLLNQLRGQENPILTLPTFDASPKKFQLTPSGVLPGVLSLKYPGLYSFVGVGIDDPTLTICLDITPNGYHAVIQEGGERTFFDPIKWGDKRCIVYQSQDFIAHPSKTQALSLSPCKSSHDHRFGESTAERNRSSRTTNGTLRTYRLAALCTGEYAAFHGGTKVGALGAIMTTINRVNQVYERELGVKLVLIPNTDDLLFTDPLTDGISNTDRLIDEITAKINGIIPSGSYDLGHGFSTAGGGIAEYASVCTSNKAEGVTGSSNPVGDPFDIDFVAHEIGHQFSGDHTFGGTASSCSGNADAGKHWEPGSGSTIMAYAGICGVHNIQNQSDPYFHGGNLTIMHHFIQNGEGSSCGVLTSTGNSSPVVGVLANRKTVPAFTPLVLQGFATDPDSTDQDLLTYCWEQIDGNGELGNYDLQTTKNAIFRSYPPVASSVRYLPNLTDLAAKRAVRGINLPTLSRTLNFRLTVRDNKTNAGAVGHADLKLEVDANSGPFVVTSQSVLGINYELGEAVEVNWEVARTNLDPVNAQLVDVYLSIDGGVTYPILLLKNAENTGNVRLTLPDDAGLLSNACRVMVRASGHCFFAINQADFGIVEPSSPTFSIRASMDNPVVCGTQEAQIALDAVGFKGFDQPISLTYAILPGLALMGEPSSIVPGGSSNFGITSEGTLPSGAYELRVTGVSGSQTKTTTLPFILVGSIASADLGLTAPLNGEQGVGIHPVFEWAPNPIFTSYRLELDTAADFGSLYGSRTTSANRIQLDRQLEGGQSYYWRIIGVSLCGGEFKSPIFTFATSKISCQTFENSTNLPLPNGRANFSSAIEVDIQETIADLQVTLRGMHQYTDDLRVSLVSPNEQSVVLFGSVCNRGAGEDFDLTLDDESTRLIPCTPTDAGSYLPQEPLATFDGLNTSGRWVLEIEDVLSNTDQGVLENWSIEFCSQKEEVLQPAFLENNDLRVGNQEVEITPASLLAIDPNGSSELVVYTVLSSSSLGVIKRNMVELTIGQTFTQAELNKGWISFFPKSGRGEPIQVALKDQEGAISQTYVLNIRVNIETDATLLEPIQAYPNPTTGKLQIDHPGDWALFNLLGEKVIQSQKTQIDISWLPAGMYILKTRHQSLKLIKQ